MNSCHRILFSVSLALLFVPTVQAEKAQQLSSLEQVPKGLAKSDWKSIRAAYEAGRHAFIPIEGGWQARNPGQQWTSKFDGRGFVSMPKDGAWQWGLELQGYGFHGAVRLIKGVPVVNADGQRLTYGWDTALTEWFVNDQRGLEHGYTVQSRPTGAADASLEFQMAVRGSLVPRVSADAKGLEFQDASGTTVINYSGLKVWDADGKILTSHFTPIDPQRPSLVRLSVDERGARYPLTIDPIAQQAYLRHGTDTGIGNADDHFGRSVSVSGDTVVVGASGEDSSTLGVNSTPNESASATGAAYVFVRSGVTWSQQAYIKANQVSAGDSFGSSVSVSGDTLVVGAPGEGSSTTGVNSTPNKSSSSSGAAYVFVRNGVTWSQQAYLKASQVNTNDNFGSSVAISGNTVVVGAQWEDSSTLGVNSTPNESASASGAAYVFVRSGVTWSQQAYLKASQVNVNDNFGSAVTVSDDTVVVGAPGEDSSTMGVNSTPNESASSSGAAYVFVRNGEIWSQQAYLKANQVSVGDNFGISVAVSSDTVAVGAFWEDSSTTGVNSTPDESASASGAAYVFVRSGVTWSQQAYLKASQVNAVDYFGISVAVSGDTVVVGTYLDDSSTTGVNSTPDESAGASGAAYVFVRSGVTWSQQAYLKASQVSAADYFGVSVAVSGDIVVVGAFGEDSSTQGVNPTPDELASDSGAGYVFLRSGVTWSQQAYLKLGTDSGIGNANDGFGYSVAVSGDTVVVGAPSEDSGTTGVNSAPNKSAISSGAAYVFVRNGDMWSQQAYLKASQVSADDNFGRSVAVSDDTVVVGADLEDSSTAGVNSMPDEIASASGAAYVFVRSGVTWTQQAYLKASQVNADDNFGISVAVSDNTVVVGARWEDSSTTGVNSTPNESGSSSGAAYVFVRSGMTWSQQAYLKASQVSLFDVFGISVSVSGDTVVVGASGEDSSTLGVNSTPNESASASGAAYVFVRSGVTWSQQAYLKASQVNVNDSFGSSVSVSGDTLVVGASGEGSSTTGVNSTPNKSSSSSGAAYVFVRNGVTWSQQAYLKASQVNTNDNFGSSVAISGNTVVVGAQWEDSSTLGVNSTPNESASASGAAYVFVRSGVTWSQQAYLKAGNTGEGDNFGISVAVSSATVVVGASGEDSSTMGVNSTPNESASSSGAAYVFNGFGLETPKVTSIAPATGSSSGGTSVTITGTSFTGTTSVTIGGTVATGVSVFNDSTITCTTPAGTAGATSVLVTTPLGTNAANSLYVYNDPPTNIILSSTSISENNTTNATVGTLSTIDPNPADTFTYSFASGGADNASFSIVGSTLRITPSANFETKSSYALNIRCTDANGLFFEKSFTISITDVNDAPTFTAYNTSTLYQKSVAILLSELLTNAADADGDAFAVTVAGPASAQGGGAALQGGSILYTPAAGFLGTDTFSITITDARGARANATVTVNVQINTGVGTNAVALSVLSGGRIGIGFQGVPGLPYEVQRSIDLSGWSTLTTFTAAANGAVIYIDDSPPPNRAFYRLIKP